MDHEDLIDKIIRGISLTNSESQLWDEIKDNPEIMEELSLLKNMSEPLRIVNRKLLKEQLRSVETNIIQERNLNRQQDSSIDKEDFKKQESNILSLPKWLFAAATILLLAAVTYLMMPHEEPENLFASYYNAYPSIVNPILKGEKQSDDQISQAYIDYQNKDYQKAMNAFSTIETTNDTILFYKAISHIELNQLSAATIILTELKSKNNRFSQEAAWYEALCFLKSKNEQQARTILSGLIKSEEHPYHQEALNLLDKLK